MTILTQTRFFRRQTILRFNGYYKQKLTSETKRERLIHLQIRRCCFEKCTPESSECHHYRWRLLLPKTVQIGTAPIRVGVEHRGIEPVQRGFSEKNRKTSTHLIAGSVTLKNARLNCQSARIDSNCSSSLKEFEIPPRHMQEMSGGFSLSGTLKIL